MAPLPESRHHFALVPLEGRLYSIGGYPGEGSGFTEEAWAYDPAIDAWEAVASLPAPLGAHAAAALNGLIYVVGGVSPIPDAGRTLLIYDPEADSWSTHPELMPTAREHVVAVAFEGQLWVIGGRTGENLDVVEIFDPESGVWTEGPRLATPTSGHTAVVFDGEIHVTGGEDLIGVRIIREHQVIGSDETSWRLEEEIPMGRHGLGSGVISGGWYVAAGGPGVDLSVSARVDVWNPSP